MMSVGTNLSVGNLSIIPGIGLSTRLGATIGDNLVAFGTLDHLGASGDADGENASGSLTTVGAGGKFFVGDLNKNDVSGYLVAELFTVFPRSDIDDEVDSVVDDISSFGVLGGFGGEYFPVGKFSISAEVGLMRFAGKYSEDDFDVQGAVLNTYSSLLFSFYL